MLFSELKSLDAYGAFGDYITVEEAKERGLIPSSIAASFPNKCECGSDMIITVGLKRICCCDPTCYIKQGYGLEFWLKNAGIRTRNIGEVACRSVMRYFSIRHPNKSFAYMITRHLKEMDTFGVYGREVQQAVIEALSRPWTFSGIIGNCGLPAIGKDVGRCFDNFNTPEEWLEHMQAKCNNSIQMFFFYNNIEDVTVLFYFRYFMPDIMDLTDMYYNKMKKGERTINIVVTGAVYPDGNKMNRNEFINYCNMQSMAEDGTRLFDIKLTSARHSVLYVICDEPSSSESYMVASRREQETGRKIIYTSTEFLNLIREEIRQYNDAIGQLQ